jgi:P27 family predicted phage terminase small subunit
LIPGRCPEPPEWTAGSPETLELWNTYAPILNRLGLLETLDQLAFGMLCDAVAGYLRIRDELQAEQLVLLIGDNGYPTPNPLAALMRGQTKAVRELLSDFGMTPSSRSSLTGSTSVEPRAADEADPLAALLDELNRPIPLAKPKAAARKRPTKKKTPTRKPATKTK